MCDDVESSAGLFEFDYLLTCVTCGCSVASNWQPGRPRSDLHLNNLHHLDCC